MKEKSHKLEASVDAVHELCLNKKKKKKTKKKKKKKSNLHLPLCPAPLKHEPKGWTQCRPCYLPA